MSGQRPDIYSFASFKKADTIIIITMPTGNAAIMLTD